MKKKVFCLTLLLIFVFVLGACAKENEVLVTSFLAGDIPTLEVIDKDGGTYDFVRGTEVLVSDKKEIIDEQEYLKIYIDDKEYYIKEEYLVEKKEDCIKEKELWVYRTCTVYLDDSSSKIAGLIEKGTKINITGSSLVKNDGSVDRYKFDSGYVLAKYLTDDEDYAKSQDQSDYAKYLQTKTEDDYGAGSISTLDYYASEKPKFEDNIMPDVCKTLYLNAEALADVEDYIAFAKETKVNAFVVDIKDTDVISVAADTMKEYSTTSFEHGIYTKEEFTSKIKQIKDNGFYVIARITVFKDRYFTSDHEEYSILDKNDNNKPFYYGGSTWPSAFCRGVWEYNIELSKEVITDFGFNEVQFDYVRFPEQIDYYADILDALDLRNEYGETRSEAIQRFLMYAADEIHAVKGYVSADVFGETANDYVCAYGQYLPAISNVVDVVSPMPYPDHFNMHDYGISEAVWEVPYKLLSTWGTYVKKQQSLIPSPAKNRCYIQGYDSIHEPYVRYDSGKIAEQIEGLIDADIYDGYIIWNAGSYIDKYQTFKEALSKY